jgi:predicted ATPase
MKPSQPNTREQPSPAYFLSLHLENVRSFGAKQEIRFYHKEEKPSQWTIILGNNGVGKTTILKSLVALTPSEDSSGNKAKVQPAIVSNWRHKWSLMRHQGEKDAELSCDLYYGSSITDAKKGIIAREFKVRGKFVDGSHIHVSEIGYTTGSTKNLGGLQCYGYGAGRSLGRASLNASYDLGPAASLFDERAELLNPEEWFLQIDYSYQLQRGNEKLKLYREQVRKALLEVLPEVEDIRVTETARFKQGLEFQTPYGWVRLPEMSLGYQTLIAWLVDFASRLFERYPESQNPLAEPAVVLVDEIDLHLHPEWQRKLVGFLSKTFPQTQFIVTAHSPLVVQAAGDANVVLLQREGDQVVVKNDVESVKNWRVDQILTSELFGLETARSLETEQLLKKRTALLSKKQLSTEDKNKLQSLNKQMGVLPVGETPEEIRADTVLRELAKKLGKGDMLK